MGAQIAFIGLGNMGVPMAANLVRAGFDVAGFDPTPSAVGRASEAGVAVAASATEAAAGAGVVITMLPSGRHVLDAYGDGTGGNGLLAAARPDSLFIDSSTIAVDDARTASTRATAAGHRFLDAPVSGGVMGAEAGSLTFMVGGPAGDVDAAAKVFAPMAGRVVHCGDVGAGQAAKVCNNLMLAISMIGVSEAFVLGERLGLSHQALFDVASTASGQCWALTTNCPVPGPVPGSPANREYRPGFATALMAKDLGLAMRAVESTGADSRIGAMAEGIYREFAGGAGATLDFSAIIAEIRERSTGGKP